MTTSLNLDNREQCHQRERLCFLLLGVLFFFSEATNLAKVILLGRSCVPIKSISRLIRVLINFVVSAALRGMMP